MQDCATTRDWIMEVDPEDLHRLGSGHPARRAAEDHARHLARCPECRALADRILGAEAALRDGLDSVEPALDVESALARAREAHRASRARRRRLVALPLAAAALGGVLLVGRPGFLARRSPVPSPAPVASFDPATARAARTLGLAGTRPLVRAGGHGRVAVLPTENPNITVIWFME